MGIILKKTLRKPDKLRFKSEFERVRANGTKLVGPSMLLVYAEAPDSSLRCGVICGRKYSLLAVKRNRARRLLWESFRILRGTLPPVWMILIPRNRRNGGTADQSEADSVRGGLAARMLIAIIRVYQWTIAPLLPNCCRFEPTCSHYAVEALRLHGFWRGTGLTIWRLMRCQPFCRGGVDPVPPRRCDCPGARRGKR